MSVWQVLFDVVVLLGAGALLGGLLERLRQSAIIGYLLAGVLLGPNALHVIESGDEVLAVSELGVALLLFAIGLEFSWSRLRAMGRVALGSGVLQVLVTAAIGAGVALLAGFESSSAIALGGIVALSSTACVLRVLTARGEVESVHGERALGILLVQDMAVVPLVLIVGILAEGGSAQETAVGLARATGVGLVLVAALYVAFHHVVPRILHSGPVHSNRELPLLVAVVSGLGSGVAAHEAGVSPALGAFVAGLLLAESPFAVQVRADVGSLKTLLLTLFFTAMGMLSDPAWIVSNAALVGAAVVLVIGIKSAVVWGALRALDSRGPVAIAAGLCLGQVGEFSFVLAEIGRGSLFSEDLFALVISTAIFTMLLTPYLVAFAPRIASRLARRRWSPGEGADEDRGPLGIVVGFGPAGRIACERIAESRCQVVVVDQNPQAVRAARELGYGAIAGDALYAEVLEHAGIERAATVVVAVPSARVAREIVDLVRRIAPRARLVVRARFHRSVPELREAGADVVVDEESEVGRAIAAAFDGITANADVPEEEESAPGPDSPRDPGAQGEVRHSAGECGSARCGE